MAGLRLTEIPLDLEPVSFQLAVDELERLYEIPLIAPRVFRKVARQRALAAAWELHASAPSIAGVATSGPALAGAAAAGVAAAGLVAAGAAASPSISPSQQLMACDTVTGDVACNDAGVVGVATGSPRASNRSAVESTTASTPTFHTCTAATGGLSGFLVSELGSRGAFRGVSPLGSTTATAVFGNGVGGVLQPPSPPPPPQQQQQQQDGEAAVEAEVAESSQTVESLNADPRDFPMLPPHRLATLLLDCAARRVPLRISVLQAYAKQVSYKASELTAEEIVCALEGLSKYNFQSSQPLAVSRSGVAGNTGSRIGGNNRYDRTRRPSNQWADLILKSLLDPVVSERTTPSPAVEQADSARANRNPGSSKGSHKSSRRSSGNTWPDRFGKGSVGGRQMGLPKVVSLEPSRFVQLTKVLVQLGISPPPDWMDGFLYGSSHIVPRMNGSDVIEFLELLAALSAAPPAAWWNVALDSWPPTTPLPPPPPPPPPAGGRGSDGDGAEAAVTSSAAEPARSRFVVADVGHPDGTASGSGDGWSKINRCVSARKDRSAINDDAGYGDASRPSDLDVRSAVLYGISRLGKPHGAGVPALAARLPGWARATLYDIARAVLVSEYLAWGATAKEPYDSRDGWSSSPPFSSSGGAAAAVIAVRPARGTGTRPVGAAEADAPMVESTTTGSKPQISISPARPLAAPAPRVIAQALAALPAVLPNASSWVSEPSGHGSGVLAVLLTALEPHLQELPPGLMLDLLRGLATSRVHPGPRFLVVHAMILKRSSTMLTPRELLLAARCYSKLGLTLKGGLRAAVLRALKALRSV
ncbi:hypothetical protein Vretimale_12014 [Volvox reticuliferus]|nr:hypothetical protein Vretifemale_11377 [Volvox reticuliferus]GIM07936.1 hypothetical protein Vretimale_12014 [Volvox reticuliferus]